MRARTLAESADGSSHSFGQMMIVGPLCPRIIRRSAVKPRIGEEDRDFVAE